MSSLVS